MKGKTMRPNLSIIIANYKTLEFVELLVYALRKLTSKHFTLYIVDNGSSKAEQKKLWYLADKFYTLPQTDKGGSMNHGICLDFAISKIKTEYVAIFDSDCVPLVKGWDKLFYDYKLAGNPPFIFMAKTKHLKKFSCKPTEVYDTCRNLKSERSMLEINTRLRPVPIFEDIYCTLYCPVGLKVVASHFGRGSCGGAPKYLKGIKYFGFLKKSIGFYQKKKWIKICKGIIDENS